MSKTSSAQAKVAPQQTVLTQSLPQYTVRFDGEYRHGDRPVYAFRFAMADAPALDAMTLKNRLTSWAFSKLCRGFVVGNGFPHMPGVAVTNQTGKDVFIILSSLTQVRVFEKRFTVLGFTPTMKI